MLKKKATDEQLLEVYSRLNSVWKVADELGMCGQSVWERLKKLGIEDKDKWTIAQLMILKEVYSAGLTFPININALAELLGKPKSSISFKARALGLTSRTRKRPAGFAEQCGEGTRTWLQTHPHPKGNSKNGKLIKVCPKCGKFFETYQKAQSYCGVSCAHNHSQVQKHQGYSKSGRRSDLNNQYFRSRYEANYARYLNFLISNGEPILKWEFEPETFEFKKIKKGTRFYTPDFRVTFRDGRVEYHEVKGWDYPKGKTARKRFAKYFPQFKLVLIDTDWFKAAKRQGLDKLIQEWE